MRVAITGSSGFIGGYLQAALAARNDEPIAVRRQGPAAIRWDPRGGFEPEDALSEVDAIVHLAGANVGQGRWTEARKREILDSRVSGTRAVVDAIDVARPRPAVAVFASAVGYYGDRGDEPLDETATAGEGFLAEVTARWEAEALRARDLAPTRVAILRFGVVLGRGGALAKMLPVFRLGLGGRLGHGGQWFPWVHIQDVVRAILHVLDHEDASGIFNVVSPNPVTNRELTASLGRVLHRPAVMPIPRLAVLLAFGRMGQETVLAGQRVVPDRLPASGFRFAFPHLEPALEEILGHDRPTSATEAG